MTDQQVLQLLRQAHILSGWPVLPPDPDKAQEKARAWAEALDNRLIYADAIDIVKEHCCRSRQPLAIADLNEPRTATRDRQHRGHYNACKSSKAAPSRARPTSTSIASAA